MIALSLKRQVVLAILAVFTATAAFATNPSARYETRMVWDAQSMHMILFGGATGTDSGTRKIYRLDDTWEFSGSRWVQRYPAHTPAGRSAHSMVYDTNRSRIVMFGGRSDTADLGDTWVYQNNDWTQLNPATAPPARQLAGAAYDVARDRIVLFGGTETSADGKTLTPVHDTWEFDGTTWKQIGGEGPAISKPLLAYDAARNQVIMLGLDATVATQMYAYDPAAGTWNQLKPTTLPPCVNEGGLAYQEANHTLVYTGGVCTNATGADETYEWDGTNWNKITLLLADSRVFGAAFAYDPDRQVATLFGGSPVVGLPVSDTWVYASGAWFVVTDSSRPGPRSLFVFTTDPVNNTIWLFGGTDDFTTFSDFWRYDNGAWTQVVAEGGPVGCVSPTAAFDTDRSKLVVVCADASTTYEWDGAAWKSFAIGTKNAPPFHRFASMAYDQTLKKTVLFGGFDATNYLDQTWLWDGATWTQQKKNPPSARILASMWYDPALKKTVIYGGIGRVTSTDRVTRYSDMWTFDGNGWTQLTPTGTATGSTPGMRYGAQTAIDPRSNHVLLFGGLRVDTNPPIPPSTAPDVVQVYANDQWEWDGSVWTQIHAENAPPPRENGRIAFDSTRNEMVMFGGYAGHFLSDLWSYNPTKWQVKILDPIGPRRRVAH
jgi:hypothetical protein